MSVIKKYKEGNTMTALSWINTIKETKHLTIGSGSESNDSLLISVKPHNLDKLEGILENIILEARRQLTPES